MSKKDEALKLALEALDESLGYVEEEAENAQRLYGQYPTRQARIQGLKDDARKHMDAITAIREALAEQPAQGCEFCSHPLYAGTKCKNCGKPAQQQEIPKIGCVNHDCDKCKAQQQQPVAVYVGETWCGSVVRLYEDLPLETPLYTSPPASKPLTDDRIWGLKTQFEKDAEMKIPEKPFRHVVRAIEAAHGITGEQK